MLWQAFGLRIVDRLLQDLELSELLKAVPPNKKAVDLTIDGFF
jgi:hypothetical protein